MGGSVALLVDGVSPLPAVGSGTCRFVQTSPHLARKVSIIFVARSFLMVVGTALVSSSHFNTML